MIKKIIILLIFLVVIQITIANNETNTTIEEINNTIEENITDQTNTTIEENITEPDNTIEEINKEVTDPNKCDVSLKIITEKQIFEQAEKITFYNTLSNTKHKFSITYSIEDINQNIVKKEQTTEKLFQTKWITAFIHNYRLGKINRCSCNQPLL